MKHSFLIIGLSQFGRQAARKLVMLGEDVLAVDIDMEKVDRISGEVDARQGDCLDEAVLQALDLPGYDHVIIAISEDIQASALVTTLVKEMGAKHIICQSYDEKHSRLLHRIGADYVVCPEVDMGERIARKFSADLLDFIPLSGDQSIAEINVPAGWIGKTLRELNVRAEHGVNVIGIRAPGTQFLDTNLNPDRRFGEKDTLMVIGRSKNIARMLQ
ncbi:MAG: TrkA family potassium uptake protein [Clostridia bacterium]|nr:TrkA family potassium uptake protein [Clostridia bacterium]